ncbi:hypothetical protein K470DRAFT_269360 [Piedraia hortae CBS 480.64]|uniref:Protein kinase domain-containing protein n=1 Tax=Piedraia hortae CBS 480.64 TaxID=1314780 RepID=A0A6A7C4D6_9PEZI|nr:hypothetical protein K470DRAFT_269360 [Piedraia hortae CBS 480.64]
MYLRVALEVAIWGIHIQKSGIVVFLRSFLSVLRLLPPKYVKEWKKQNSKSDVFGAGLLVYGCMHLHHSDYFQFDWDIKAGRAPNPDKPIKEPLFPPELEKNYSQTLLDLVKQMVRIKIDERPYFREVLDRVQKATAGEPLRTASPNVPRFRPVDHQFYWILLEDKFPLNKKPIDPVIPKNSRPLTHLTPLAGDKGPGGTPGGKSNPSSAGAPQHTKQKAAPAPDPAQPHPHAAARPGNALAQLAARRAAKAAAQPAPAAHQPAQAPAKKAL